MKAILIVAVLIATMAMAGIAVADVQEDWPLDKPNTYDPPYILVDFNEGTCMEDIGDYADVIFFNESDWVYGCRDSGLNIYSESNTGGSYVVNGECGAWCGTSGSAGNVSFAFDVGHVSMLASINTHLYLDAYNSDGELVASVNAGSNGGTHNFTRMSVDREECDISYVCIHDSGNYWIIDDLLISCTSAQLLPATISIGDAFNVDTVPIMVTGSNNVGSVDLTLTYDPTIVTVTGVTGGDMDAEFWNLEDNGDGEIRIGAYQTTSDGLSGDFVLVNVSFAPVSDGVCPFGISVTTFKDATPVGVHMPYDVITGNYSSYSNGDVNGDGVVDMFDAMYLAKHVIGMSGFGNIIEVTADVNGDGIIDIADASYLAKHIIGIGGYEELK